MVDPQKQGQGTMIEQWQGQGPENATGPEPNIGLLGTVHANKSLFVSFRRALQAEFNGWQPSYSRMEFSKKLYRV